jgi:hypothetical protein
VVGCKTSVGESNEKSAEEMLKKGITKRIRRKCSKDNSCPDSLVENSITRDTTNRE